MKYFMKDLMYYAAPSAFLGYFTAALVLKLLGFHPIYPTGGVLLLFVVWSIVYAIFLLKMHFSAIDKLYFPMRALEEIPKVRKEITDTEAAEKVVEHLRKLYEESKDPTWISETKKESELMTRRLIKSIVTLLVGTACSITLGFIDYFGLL